MPALLTDLDRTLTDDTFRVDAPVRERLAQLREAGVLTILVTGRPLAYLVEERLDTLFDAVVPENGCIVSVPGRGILEVAHPDFAPTAQRALGPLAERLVWGRVLGSAPRELAPELALALDAARVPHALIYNANEVMLLPPGVDKASGARRALQLLDAQAEPTWAIGDGENDIPLLELAGVGGVPENAHPAARAVADVLLPARHGHAFLLFTEALLRAPPPTGAAAEAMP